MSGTNFHKWFVPDQMKKNNENGYFRLDFLIEKKFVLEIKSIESLQDIHLAQILTYLRLSNCKLGMLINFNTIQFKNGVKRVINGIL